MKLKKDGAATKRGVVSAIGCSAYSRKVVAWVKAQAKAIPGTLSVRHIFPRAFCIAKPTPGCAVVMTPWVDAEPQIREFKWASSHNVTEGADKIAAGDWCAIAYLVAEGNQRMVAFPLPNPTVLRSPRLGGGSVAPGCWASESKGK